MKTWLKISALCSVGVIFFGIVFPVYYAQIDGNINSFEIFLVLLMIVFVSTVFAVTMYMISYADDIDRLDEKEREINRKEEILNLLIKRYNELIIEQETVK